MLISGLDLLVVPASTQQQQSRTQHAVIVKPRNDKISVEVKTKVTSEIIKNNLLIKTAKITSSGLSIDAENEREVLKLKLEFKSIP
ncbi:hypothetical protein NPIL_221141 [Nephila pilipes]|uniref:Uncharacterized protein n=1 Tax=Nephila pilipes TaxID=299642 RepID=A0A8X6MU85_NEPPI|nr:hypothetical protein NPIL_221141 [Nephila pilipes]